MRDDSWLSWRLNQIWQLYFNDIARKNKIVIKFGREALYRFGSIRLNYSDKSTLIRINGRFKNPKYPQEILDHTIAHELVHYAQGFSSPNPRMHRYPHRGGVIDKELTQRGLKDLVFFYKKWVKDYLDTL